MKTVIINDNERGLLFKNGKFTSLLEPGKYRCFGSTNIEILTLDGEIKSDNCQLETLLADKSLASMAAQVQIADNQIALHFIDGSLHEVLHSGRYAYLAVNKKHEFTLIDTTEPEITPDICKFINRIPTTLYQTVSVAEYEKAKLYYNNKFVRLLDGGIYYFWRGSVQVSADKIDTRLTQITITGQELLTADKVALRVSFVCNYRVLDCIKIVSEVDDFREQIHIAAQLAMRDYVGKRTLDEVLAQKEEMSEYVGAKLCDCARSFYVEISNAGVRDIILPGEIRDIMNTVLLAEKRAQANVITRREEVASTRSLLNTAKLMDENQTLYRLKELEYLEKICEQVGSISINGQGDIISQLSALMKK
ncbi:MAG: slipin family protein [Clostridiales bacterium]|nr:slipin family protein [Clostridiales bacterium]